MNSSRHHIRLSYKEAYHKIPPYNLNPPFHFELAILVSLSLTYGSLRYC